MSVSRRTAAATRERMFDATGRDTTRMQGSEGQGMAGRLIDACSARG